MAKNKKKKKQNLPAAPETPKKVVNYRRILYLAVCFLAAMTVYQLALQLFFIQIVYVYEGIAAALLIWYCIVNQGFGKLTLSPTATEEERTDYERRIRVGKRILGVFFAVILTLIIDLIDLFILDSLRDMFSN